MPESTDEPGWPRVERGGETVQPVPTPDSIREDKSNNERAGGRSQKERLLRRGNAISGAPIIRGDNQLPKPPIIVGMTKKKIMIKACAVTTVLYNWSSPRSEPEEPSSKRMTAERPAH